VGNRRVSPSLNIVKSLEDALSGVVSGPSPIVEFLLDQPGPAALLGIDGIYRKTNGSFLTTIGRLEDDVVGNSASDVFPDLARAVKRKFGESIEAALKRRRNLYKITCPASNLPGKFISHRLDLVSEQQIEPGYIHEVKVGDLPGGTAQPT
jgi:hypothetical protein